MEIELDGFKGEISENPSLSIASLDERLRKGDALIVWYSGISKKDERELKKDAKEFLKHKKGDVRVHFVSFGNRVFQVIE